jgi:hypothetical protein
MHAPKALTYLAEAQKCEKAAAQATRAEVGSAYRTLADQWRCLARQAGELEPAE